jgi:leucyl/phenylalanyl-tRNA---protein transferase
VPIDPPSSPWGFPSPDQLAAFDGGDLIGVGADLEPGTILAAYRCGLFPMPLSRRRIGWWSPDPRGVLPLDGLVVSKSLRRSVRRYEVRVDERFDDVIAACADRRREHGWIDRRIIAAYRSLFDLGWVHTVETYDPDTGALVGGLYGVAIGGLFAGESMFHHATDASKVALVALVDRLRHNGFVLLDVQWKTDHLASLGVREIVRPEYLGGLRNALDVEATW